MTRIVTGTIRTPTGEPWSAFELAFRVKPSTSTLAATYPEGVTTVTTGEDGTFSVDLETGIVYQVELTTIFVPRGVSIQYPPGSLFTIVVPAGEGPISLEAVRALGHPIPPPSPSVVDAVVAAVLARLIPAGGLQGQVLTKASDDDFELVWRTPRTGYGQ